MGWVKVCRVSRKLINGLTAFYRDACVHVKVKGEVVESCIIQGKMMQGCVMSPFNEVVREMKATGCSVGVERRTDTVI